jgi:hypothetical protein
MHKSADRNLCILQPCLVFAAAHPPAPSTPSMPFRACTEYWRQPQHPPGIPAFDPASGGLKWRRECVWCFFSQLHHHRNPRDDDGRKEVGNRPYPGTFSRPTPLSPHCSSSFACRSKVGEGNRLSPPPAPGYVSALHMAHGVQPPPPPPLFGRHRTIGPIPLHAVGDVTPLRPSGR